MCRMGFITGGPNEAIVVSGVFHSQPLIVVGGWAFVIPCIQKVQRLPLNIMTLKVSSPKVYTTQGVPLSVTGIAQVWYTFWSVCSYGNFCWRRERSGRFKYCYSYSLVAKASQLLIVDAEKLNLGSRPTWKIHSHLHIQSIEDH